MKQIVITFGNGEVTIDAIGFRGSECELKTKPFEQLLGSGGNRKKKPEYSLGRQVAGQQKVQS